MDERWYNKSGADSDLILVSRIRLLRNFSGWKFPNSLADAEREELCDQVQKKLTHIADSLGCSVRRTVVEQSDTIMKTALKERLLINQAALESEKPVTVYASTDEAFSMTLNGTDHIRLLISGTGQNLAALYDRIDIVDNYINSRMPYAFSKKLGFKTAGIQNVGTGMRAYYVMHLPLLSEEKSFNVLSQEIGKYGVVIKEAWSQGAKRIGGLYVLYNQRTLGLKESDIIDILTNVANRLMRQEREMREKTDPLILKDRVFRSYGVLQYAVKLDLSEACIHLSNLQLGVSMGYLKPKTTLSVYELMLGMLPGNLQIYYEKAFDEKTIKQKRAQYLQDFLKFFEIAR